MNRYYIIDHKILFLFGYVFYLFTPYVVGTFDLFEGFPGIILYQRFFKKIPSYQLLSYAVITLLWLPAFYLGHLTFKLYKPYKKNLHRFPETATSHVVPYIAILLALVLAVFTFLGRHSLFGGYGSYDISARGKLSTLLVLFNFFIAYQMVSRQKTSYLLIAGAVFTAFLLLSMGGRMYVIQTLVVLLVGKTSFAAVRFKAPQILLFLLSGFLLGSVVGLWRMGFSFGAGKAAYSLFAEPVFTWFSTSTYLISNDIPLFNVPLNFITSFFNLVPNTFFSLTPYVVSTYDMVANYESPLGADSVWTNIVINFGSLGSMFFIFITGFLLNFLRHLSENSRFGAVYYILVCSLLPFQFFRDGFYLINKQLFFNFLLLPACILYTFRLVTYAANYRRVAVK